MEWAREEVLGVKCTLFVGSLSPVLQMRQYSYLCLDISIPVYVYVSTCT